VQSHHVPGLPVAGSRRPHLSVSLPFAHQRAVPPRRVWTLSTIQLIFGSCWFARYCERLEVDFRRQLVDVICPVLRRDATTPALADPDPVDDIALFRFVAKRCVLSGRVGCVSWTSSGSCTDRILGAVLGYGIGGQLRTFGQRGESRPDMVFRPRAISGIGISGDWHCPKSREKRPHVDSKKECHLAIRPFTAGWTETRRQSRRLRGRNARV
jgi:hypothetical protein